MPRRADQLVPELLANPTRLANEAGRHELDDGRGDCFGEMLSDGPCRWRCDNELVLLLVAHERRARTASTPRTTSPRA